MEEKTIFPATLEEVSNFTLSLEAKLHKLPIEVRTSIVLGIQELLVNVVKHAYAGDPGQIEFRLTLFDTELKISVVDYAKNVFTMPETVDAPDLVDLPEGGMGLFIIQQSFDRVKYEHLSNGNRWDLEKALGG